MNYPRSKDRWVSNPINRLIISNKVLYQDSWLRRRFPPFSGLTGNFIWKGYLTWLSLIMLPRIHIVLFMKMINYISPFIPLAKASGFSGEKLINGGTGGIRTPNLLILSQSPLPVGPRCQLY